MPFHFSPSAADGSSGGNRTPAGAPFRARVESTPRKGANRLEATPNRALTIVSVLPRPGLPFRFETAIADQVTNATMIKPISADLSARSAYSCRPRSGESSPVAETAGPLRSILDAMRSEFLLDLFRERENPGVAILDHLVDTLHASFAISARLESDDGSGRGLTAIVGRIPGSRPLHDPGRVLRESRQLRASFGDTTRFTTGGDRDGSNWLVSVPVYRSAATGRRLVSSRLILGGRLDHLPASLGTSPGSVFGALETSAAWIEAALLRGDSSPAVTSELDSELWTLLKDLEGLSPFDPQFPGVVAASRGMIAVLDTVKKIASSDAAVLIVGESGTGKEVIAQAVHRESKRSSGPFVTENCAACPENLMESEFFGVQKGAFTGASTSRAGVFERANHGTLFLDEIADLDLSLQVKLLRVLQEREVRRVGGRKQIPVDFRLISATNRQLDEDVLHKRFRLDLLYRLEIVRIRIPPLRERIEDIPHLAFHFLSLHASRLGRETPPHLTAEALGALLRYWWPGNVRELENEMARALAFGYDSIMPKHLSDKVKASYLGCEDEKSPAQICDFYEAERDLLGALISAAIRYANGNRASAAKMLNMPKTSFYRRIRRYGIDAEKARSTYAPISRVLSRYRFLDQSPAGRTRED